MLRSTEALLKLADDMTADAEDGSILRGDHNDAAFVAALASVCTKFSLLRRVEAIIAIAREEDDEALRKRESAAAEAKATNI